MGGLRRWLESRRIPADLRPVLKTEGMVSLAEAELLHRLAREVTEGCIVEVGSYRGRSTVALATGARAGGGAPVFAVDPHERMTGILGAEFGAQDRARFFQAMLRTGCVDQVRLLNTSSEVVTPAWPQRVGLLFLDGDHTEEGVTRDYDCWRPHLREDARVAFDDSTNPDIGPYRLIEKRVASGHLEEVEQVGKVRVFRLGAAARSGEQGRAAGAGS